MAIVAAVRRASRRRPDVGGQPAHGDHGPTRWAQQSKITTQEGVAIVQRGNNVRIVKGDGDELEVNLPPVEEIIASKMPRLIADGTVTWYFLLAAWCAFFIAMTQQHRTRITELRLAEAETAAHAAQVRALRYQVNPHFLFNTLNSLSVAGHVGPLRPRRGNADGAVDLLPHQPVDRPVGRRQPGGGDRAAAALSRYREGPLSRTGWTSTSTFPTTSPRRAFRR